MCALCSLTASMPPTDDGIQLTPSLDAGRMNNPKLQPAFMLRIIDTPQEPMTIMAARPSANARSCWSYVVCRKFSVT